MHYMSSTVVIICCLLPTDLAGGVWDGGEDMQRKLQRARHSLLPSQPPTSRDDLSWRNRQREAAANDLIYKKGDPRDRNLYIAT